MVKVFFPDNAAFKAFVISYLRIHLADLEFSPLAVRRAVIISQQYYSHLKRKTMVIFPREKEKGKINRRCWSVLQAAWNLQQLPKSPFFRSPSSGVSASSNMGQTA